MIGALLIRSYENSLWQTKTFMYITDAIDMCIMYSPWFVMLIQQIAVTLYIKSVKVRNEIFLDVDNLEAG